MTLPERTLKNRILLFTTLTVILTFLIMLSAVYLFVRDYARKKARLIADISIAKASENIDRFFIDLKTLAISLSRDPDIQHLRYRAAARTLFAIARSRNKYVNSIYFGSANGIFLQRGWGSPTFRTNGGWAHSRLPFFVPHPGLLPANYDPRNRPWYKRAIKKKGVTITDPYPFAGNQLNRHGYGITISCPVYRGKKLLGVVGIDCTLNTLQHFVANAHIPQGGRLIVFGPNREILLNPFHTETNWNTVHQNLEIENIDEIFKEKAGNRTISIKGTTMVVSYCKNSESRFTLMATFSYWQLLKNGMKTFALIAGVAVLSLMVIFLALNIGLEKLTQPIRDLTLMIQRFSNRDFNSRVRINKKNKMTDIGVLGQTFNQMADAIRDYDSTILKQLYAERVTGLSNRERLLLDITSITRPILFLVNIDAFKEINDFYGTVVGDCVLREVGQRLLQNFTLFNLYKLPGDEFALLAEQRHGAHNPGENALKIREIIQSEPFHCNETEVIVHVTIGLALGDNTARLRNSEKTLLYADMALKRARERMVPFLMYSDELQIMQEYENNMKWVKKFKEAIFEDRIIPVFQPIVNNENRIIEKYECLVRIREADGGLITPANFLETARRARLYHELTRAMFIKSLDYFRDLSFEFSINISADDILNSETNSFLLSILKEEPDVSKRLVFELTETQEIESYNEVKKFMLDVKKHGARIAIDDFGTGYSNFGYILELNVDYIKIDASLIKNIDTDSNSEAIVSTIANFAQRLGIKTIAEYVHDEAVFNKIRELGIDYSQGYFFGAPEESTG